MFRSEVWKTWALVLQLGISVMVPVFLLIVVAFLVDKYFKIDMMLIAVILGVVVGVRNAYVLLKNYINTMPKNSGSELQKKHLKEMGKE